LKERAILVDQGVYFFTVPSRCSARAVCGYWGVTLLISFADWTFPLTIKRSCFKRFSVGAPVPESAGAAAEPGWPLEPRTRYRAVWEGG
jgi:hypothetical protein